MTTAPYHLAEGGVSLGCQSRGEVEAGLATGRLRAEVFSWREGEARWVRLAQRPEFAQAVQAYVTLVPRPSPPWEETGLYRGGFWARLVVSFGAIITAPRKTFAAPAPVGSLRPPFIWLGVCAALAAPIIFVEGAFLSQLTVSSALAARLGQGAKSAASFGLNFNEEFWHAFGKFLGTFPLGLILLALAGGCLVHGWLRLFRGGRGGLRVTVRAVLYILGATVLLAAIPLLGCVAPLIGSGLLVAGLSAAHGDVAWKPLLAMGGWFFVGCCAGLGSVAAALAPFFSNRF